MTDFRARRIGREWLEWARQNLPTAAPLSGATLEGFLSAARRFKTQYGAARSFEHESVASAEFSEALLGSLNRIGVTQMIATVGDPAEPVAFRLDVADLGALTLEVGRRQDCFSIAIESADGHLVVDPPHPGQGASEILVAGDGFFEAALDEFIARFPGGFEFRGN